MNFLMREISWKNLKVSQSIKVALATANWTVALTLLVTVTCGALPLVYAAWSVIYALWGATFVGWALLVRERLALERLVDLAADVYSRTGHLRSLK